MAPRKTSATAAAAIATPAAETPTEVIAADPDVEMAASDAETAVVGSSPATAASGPVDLLALVVEKTATLFSGIRDLSSLAKEIQAMLKVLGKGVAQLQKEGNKRSRRSLGKASADGVDGVVRKPSGFAKPALLSATLCEFLGVPETQLLARTDVTRMITKYVKDNQLHDEADKRTIRPDDKLLSLLDIKDNAKVTYFNLQSLIKHHFLKAAPAAVAAAAAPVDTPPEAPAETA